MELKVTNDLQASENSELRSRLDEYNEPFVGKRETIDLGYAIRNEEGDLVGGLIGSVVISETESFPRGHSQHLMVKAL